MSLNRILWVVIAAALLFPLNAFSQEEAPTPELPTFAWELGWTYVVDLPNGEPVVCLIQDNVTLERYAVANPFKKTTDDEPKRKGPKPPPKAKSKKKAKQPEVKLEFDLSQLFCVKTSKRVYGTTTKRELYVQGILGEAHNAGFQVKAPDGFGSLELQVAESGWTQSSYVRGTRKDVAIGRQTIKAPTKKNPDREITGIVFRPGPGRR